VRVSFLLLYFSPVTSTPTKHNSICTTQAIITLSSTGKSLLDNQLYPRAGSHSFAGRKNAAHHVCLSGERLHRRCALHFVHYYGLTLAHDKQICSHSCTNGAYAFVTIVRYATGGDICPFAPMQPATSLVRTPLRGFR
jgi:hypothetical protein